MVYIQLNDNEAYELIFNQQRKNRCQLKRVVDIGSDPLEFELLRTFNGMPLVYSLDYEGPNAGIQYQVDAGIEHV